MNCRVAISMLTLAIAALGAATPVPVASANIGDAAQVSPGMRAAPGDKYDYTLGKDFPTQDTVRLEYPKSTILADAAGDLLFNITLRRTLGPYLSFTIYVPPEFKGLSGNTTNIWTSYTNDYRFISLSQMPELDPIGPRWWRIDVSNTTARGISLGSHFVRIFNVRAPSICGRYFFKVFTNGTSIGAGNFPTLVVKGELNPAYVFGRILDGDQPRYGEPIVLALGAGGKVTAEGMTPQGRVVKALAYFNSTSEGCYVLYGLAPGTYDLTVSAAGYRTRRMQGAVSVYAGQSLEHVNIYLSRGVNVTGTVYSKCGFGPIPWGYVYSQCLPRPRPIRLELSDSRGDIRSVTLGNTDPALAEYRFLLREAEYDGHIPQEYANYTAGIESDDYLLRAYVNGYVQTDEVRVHVFNGTDVVDIPIELRKSSWFVITIHFKDNPMATESVADPYRTHVLVAEAYDEEGDLKGWNCTLVPPGAKNTTLEVTGFLGFREFRGLCDYGLMSRTYMIRTYLAGFLQSEIAMGTVVLCGSPTYISFDMFRGGGLKLTLVSVDWQIPRLERPWAHPGKDITIYFYDSAGEEHGYVRVHQQEGTSVVSFTYCGIDSYNLTGSITPYLLGSHDQGLSTDVYFAKAYTVGYLQPYEFRVPVRAGAVSDRRFSLLNGAKIDLTILFKTEGLLAPTSDCDNTSLRVEVYDSNGELVGGNLSYVPPRQTVFQTVVTGFHEYAGNPCLRWVNYYDTTDGTMQHDYGLDQGSYFVKVWVPGYEQPSDMSISLDGKETLSVVFELDRLAHLRGEIRWYDMWNELAPLSWATVIAYDDRATSTSSLDGSYDMWLPPGEYMLGVSLQGHATQTRRIYLSPGSETSVDFELKFGAISLPEPTVPPTRVALIAPILATMALTKTKSKNRTR